MTLKHRTKATTILRAYLKLAPTTEDVQANILLLAARRTLAEVLVLLLGVKVGYVATMTVDRKEYTVHHRPDDCWIQPA